MNEEIFRKKSLDKVKSPENLDDYIRVTNPGVWLILIFIIALLVGACIWGTFGEVNSTVNATVYVEGEKTVCLVGDSDIDVVEVGQKVTFMDKEGTIIDIGEKNGEKYTCLVENGNNLPNGVYEGKVIIGSYRPISFILN